MTTTQSLTEEIEEKEKTMKQVDEEENPSGVSAETPFLALVRRNQQLQKRVKMFQEGYRDKAFEVIALEIQILDIKATGYDARIERNFEKMKRKCLVVIEERNEARATSVELLKFAEHAPHCASNERYPSPPCDCGLSLLWLAATNPETSQPTSPVAAITSAQNSGDETKG